MRNSVLNQRGADYLAPLCEVWHFDLDTKILESSGDNSSFDPDSYVWDKDEF